MSANQSFRFGNFLLRPSTRDDLALAVAWTEADSSHQIDPPEFWIEQSLGHDCYMLEDDLGPVFFFKLHRISLTAVEVHTQFPSLGELGEEPDEAQKQIRKRVQAGIVEGFEWLESQLAKTKIREIRFDSTHPPLRVFAVRRLGFAISLNHSLSKSIGGR